MSHPPHSSAAQSASLLHAGRVLFVGAGPGDPALLTLRGHRALAEAQVVVFDADVAPGVLDGVPEGTERVRVGVAAAASPAAVAARLVERAKSGQRVVRLLAGDASSFGEEAAAVAAAGVAFEVVPGVSPAVAGAAYAGVPLTHGAGSAAAVLVEARAPAAVDWATLGAAADAVLVRVTAGTLPRVVAGLLSSGRSPETPALLIALVTTFEQRTIAAPLAELEAEARRAGLPDPAVLVVGEVTRLRSRLGWLERRPLFGRRVIITRPRAQAARLAGLLEGYGAEVVTVPTIRLEPPEEWGPLDAALERIGEFAWVVFTSVNGVAAFRERLAVAGLDARALGTARVAAIGSETAEALRQVGLRADLVPGEFRAEGVLEALGPQVRAGSEILLVRAAEAREVLPRELSALGAHVTIAPAYRTVLAKEGADAVAALFDARVVDAITFTSSSTVRGFIGLLGREDVRALLAGVVLAAIGPITAGTLAEHGLEVRVMPREYTVSALAAGIAAHFARPTQT